MTIRELAARSGYSNATVSLALRGHPRIPPATRERIVRLAEEVGYRTPPMVSALLSHVRAQRPPEFQETIALFTTEPVDLRRRRAYHREVARGAMERAEKLGYTIDSFRLDRQMSDRRLERVLDSRGIRGVIVDASCQDHSLPALNWERLSCVLVAHEESPLRQRRVLPDQYHNMELLLGNLCARGYGRIAFYNLADFERRMHGHWTAAFLWYQHSVPARRRVPLQLAEDWSPTAFVQWFRRTRPDAIVCPNWMASTWLQDDGVDVPKDVGVAVPNWSVEHPHVTGIDQNAPELGAAALDVVTAQITRNESGTRLRPRVTLIRGELREGTTLRPPPPQHSAPS